MLWGKKDEELPEKLRGKKPEDIIAALDAAEKLKADHDALKTQFDSQKSEFDTTKTKLAEIEAKLNAEPPKGDEGNPNGDPNEPPTPWADPDKWLDDKTKKLQTTAIVSGMMTAKMYFAQQLSQRDLKIYKHYEKEVDKVVESFVPEQRVMPQSWFNAFIYVKGLHDADIQKAESSKTEFFSETPTKSSHDDPPPEDKLTAEEEEVCRVMRWDREGYLAQKKAGQIVRTEKGSAAQFKVPSREELRKRRQAS